MQEWPVNDTAAGKMHRLLGKWMKKTTIMSVSVNICLNKLDILSNCLDWQTIFTSLCCPLVAVGQFYTSLSGMGKSCMSYLKGKQKPNLVLN